MIEEDELAAQSDRLNCGLGGNANDGPNKKDVNQIKRFPAVR